MKNAFKFRISVILLFILMTIGYILLAFCYTGPRYVVLIVFIVYLFISYFLFKTTGRLIGELKEREKDN